MKTITFSLLFLFTSLMSTAQVIYSDAFDENINNFTSSSSLVSSLNNNTIEIVGNGTSGSYENLRYTFHNAGTNTTIDASTSPKIYLKIKADNAPTVRIDFVDSNGYSTTLYGLTANPNTEYQIYELNYTDKLIDGGYGGSCSPGPCNVDPSQLVELAFYINPGSGGYTGTINIEWVSIGESLEQEPDLNLDHAKVVGYLPDYRFSLSNQIDYTKVTHLNICFANPDASGNIQIGDFSQVMTDALNQNPNIIFILSMAGGIESSSPTATYWSNLIDNPSNRTQFIANIVDFVNTHSFDGVDVDLEFDLVTSGYSDFIIELNAALDVHNKLITAAFPKVYYGNLTQQALETFDFINLMAYDEVGFWSPNPGQHSSYTFAEDNINFWKNHGISGEKLVLGVPFYGHNFDTTTFVTYGEMVQANVSYADVDQVGNTYYNGRPTIEQKVQLAHNKVGGIMIWELGQDSFTEYSLLTTIHEKYTALDVTTTGLGSNASTLSLTDNNLLDTSVTLYPNPTVGLIHIKTKEEINRIFVYNSLGQVLMETENNQIDLNTFPSGLYTFKIVLNKNIIQTSKIIKI